MGDNNQLQQCIIDREDIDFSWVKDILDEEERREVEHAIEFFYEHCNSDSKVKLSFSQAVWVLKYITALSLAKKKQLNEIEDLGATVGEFGELNLIHGEVTAAYKRFRFVGNGAVSIKLTGREPFRLVVVRENKYYEKNNITIYEGKSGEDNSLEILLDNKNYSTGEVSYILTIATDSTKKTLFNYIISEYTESCINEYGGVWFADKDTPISIWNKKYNKIHGYSHIFTYAIWYVHNEYVGEFIASIHELKKSKEENASIFAQLKKIYTPGVDATIVISALLSLVIKAVGKKLVMYGIGIGLVLTLVSTIFPEWENISIDTLEKLLGDVEKVAKDGDNNFANGVVIRMCVAYRKPQSDAILSTPDAPFYEVSKWESIKSGYMIGEVGYIGQKDDELPRWYLMGPPKSENNLFSDLPSVIDAIEKNSGI